MGHRGGWGVGYYRSSLLADDVVVHKEVGEQEVGTEGEVVIFVVNHPNGWFY